MNSNCIPSHTQETSFNLCVVVFSLQTKLTWSSSERCTFSVLRWRFHLLSPQLWRHSIQSSSCRTAALVNRRLATVWSCWCGTSRAVWTTTCGLCVIPRGGSTAFTSTTTYSSCSQSSETNSNTAITPLETSTRPARKTCPMKSGGTTTPGTAGVTWTEFWWDTTGITTAWRRYMHLPTIAKKRHT